MNNEQNWDDQISLTIRRGDAAAAVQAIGHASNTSEEAQRGADAIEAAMKATPSAGQEGGVEEGEDECPNSPDGAHDFEDHGGGVIKCKVCGEPRR